MKEVMKTSVENKESSSSVIPHLRKSAQSADDILWNNPQISQIRADLRYFLLSYDYDLKNHRDHRVHREMRKSSVLSVYSVVDFHYDEMFLLPELRSFKNMGELN